MKMLCEAKFATGDETLKTVPIIFYQLFTLGCVIRDFFFKCAYIYLKKKTTATYVEAISELKKICLANEMIFRPTKFLSDFESALMDSFKIVFPDVQLSGCFFHFSDCLIRRVKSYGLIFVYINDTTRNFQKATLVFIKV